MMMNIKKIIIIILILSGLILISTLLKPKCKKEKLTFPELSKSDILKQKYWNKNCRDKVNFLIENSEWPSFLSYSAWNDGCQGCKSVPATSALNDGQENNSKDSFQIIGDWMRISQRNSGSFSNISTANSKEHWFNPPRNNTNDKPLEIEWYMYMDGSEWGKTTEEIAMSGIVRANWSAFWCFGHGYPTNPDDLSQNNFGWPYSGEWDLAESLPVFSNTNNLTDNTKTANGIATGFHNGNSGAYPPCCLKRDGIMYPKPESEIDIFAMPPITGKYGNELAKLSPKERTQYLIDNNDKLYYYAGAQPGMPSSSRPFLTWGQALFKNKFGKYPDIPYEKEDDKDYFKKAIHQNLIAASMTYNTPIHCYLRVTTDQAMLYIKINVDPSNPPTLNITSDMSQLDVKQLMEENGFLNVFSSYGDFGSNNDTTFLDQFNMNLGQAGMSGPDIPMGPTNWHQNMMFVWSVLTQKNNSGRFVNKEGEYDIFWKCLTSYLSDIRIRGGGNYTKAQAPPNISDPNLVKIATEGYDSSSLLSYKQKNLANFFNVQNPDVLDCRSILS